MKRPKELANRASELRDLKYNDARTTFTLPLNAARLKARKLLDDPAGGYITIVESWRQLPDGQIEFVMRRLPTPE
jgi:hypothetical protein